MSVHERDYLERTIATVRNHRGADNCWPQWANIFADEIERLWALLEPDHHVVEIRGDDEWGMQHPARCRPNLLGCELHDALMSLRAGEWPEAPGRYRVELVEGRARFEATS
jgi:hypothetical protein